MMTSKHSLVRSSRLSLEVAVDWNRIIHTCKKKFNLDLKTNKQD